MKILYGRCGASHEEQHAAARALLREGLRLLGRDPDTTRIEIAENGKPEFQNEPALYFNLSHTPGLAVCAIGEAPCGIDVETAGRAIPDRVSDRYLGGVRGEEAVEHWTRLESFGKLTGRGLAAGAIPESVRFYTFREPEGFIITLCIGKEITKESITVVSCS